MPEIICFGHFIAYFKIQHRLLFGCLIFQKMNLTIKVVLVRLYCNVRCAQMNARIVDGKHLQVLFVPMISHA